ncbi:VanZ family protein [Paenibacillus sp. 2KB_22]|uniref:VanZ family protein n=1 Tax=Paenibacillus sp. 2KB_22 TaxID=3232978 RepID=UPI003F973B11
MKVVITILIEEGSRSRRHNHKRRRYGYLISVLLIISWILFIWSMSAQSYQQQTIQPWLHQWSEQIQWILSLPDIQFTYGEHHYSLNARPYDFVEFIFRKSAHVFVYAVLAVLVYCGMRYRRSGIKTCIGTALATVFVIASIDEYIQQFSPNRTASIRDVGVDLIGGLCGVMLWIAAVALYRKLRSFRRSHR